MRNMRQLHPRWSQLYGQPKIHKLGAPVRPAVFFYNTPLSALHKVLAHYLKPLANSSIRLKETNDFKQHLNTTGHPNFPYHTSMDIKSLYTSCDMKKSIYHHTPLPRQTPSPSTQHICFHNPIPYILLS